MSVPAETVALRGDGVRLVADRLVGGTEAAPALLLHGGGQTRHSWAGTARRLAAAGRTTYAIDLRGHGDSDWHPRADYSLDGFVSDLLAVIEDVGRPVVLIGASLGGMTALVAAGENPGIAAALVLVDIVVRVEPAGVRRIRDFMTARPDGFGSLDEVADAIAAYNPHRPRPRNLDGLRKNVRLGDDGRWRWHWDPAFMQIGDEPQRRSDRNRLRAAAAALEVPTLLVRGLRSDVVSDAGMADMLALVPDAQVADVQAAGHMVAGDDNDVFGERLQAFLASVGR